MNFVQNSFVVVSARHQKQWVQSLLYVQVRRALGDFGVLIALLCMSLLDYLIKDTYTQVSINSSMACACRSVINLQGHMHITEST